MSGIFGIINWDGKPVEHAELQRMSASMKKRGPDAEGLWIQGASCLGHRMLHTTPESLHESLPFEDNEAGLVITADARIDNREEIGDRLDARQLVRKGISDSQLIILSYRKWGKGCLDHLRGDFSFTIFDTARQQIFCTRDHFGVRPFYFHSSHNTFTFASEVRALLATGHINRKINEARMADYLLPQLEGVDYETTCYEGIYRLHPGHQLTVNANGKSTTRYWQFNAVNETRLSSTEEYKEAYREQFRKAVAFRLRCPTSPGVLLSGGIDSSTVVAEARKILESKNQKLHLLSIVDSSNPYCIETGNINKLISQGGTISHSLDINYAEKYSKTLLNSIKRSDDIFSTAVTLQKILYKYFHDQHGKVVLDGVEGDLVTSSGTGYLNQLIKEGSWINAISEARKQEEHQAHTPRVLYRLLRTTLSNIIPDRARQFRYQFSRTSNCRKSIRSSLLRPEFCNRINLCDRLDQARKSQYGTSIDTPNNEQIRSLRNPGMIPVAMDRWDRLGSEFGIELRHPFLDIDFVNFCLSLPWQLKLHEGWSKWILRYSFDSELPTEVVWRKGREHLGWNTTRRFLEINISQIEQLVTNLENPVYDYIDVEKLRITWKRFNMNSSDLDADKLWEAFSLSTWLSAQYENNDN